MIKLELTKEQQWIIAWLLTDLSSRDGAERFLKEFPDADIEAIKKQIDEVADKLFPKIK